MQIIYGRAGTGKSTYIYNEIRENIKNCKKIYIITPEQFSFNAEIKLLETIENDSTLKAEVLTFKRMAYRVINEIGGITNTNLSICGRFMLLYNLITKEQKNLNFLNNQDGNIDLISTTITELKKHQINIEDIKNAIDNTTNSSMKLKLNDIYIAYKTYEESIKNKYIDEDDILTILNNIITESKMFDNSLIYIDEFTGFTKQEYNIIESLMKLAKEVKIAVCTDDLDFAETSELNAFYENKKTANKLIEIAKKSKVVINKPIYMDKNYRFKNTALNHLEQNIFKIPYKIYEEVPEIEIFAAQNIYTEIEKIAKQIQGLIKNGYRYKEISIITKNIEQYTSIILAVFDNYNIPTFIDQKKDLASNILIKYILALLEIFSKNWSYETMFNYIKIGMLKLNKDELGLLENYVIQYGIKGSTWYKTDWKFRADEDVSLEKLNELRIKIITPLIEFKEKLQGTKTVFEITKNLYEFLTNNKIPEIMEEKINKLKEINEIQIAHEYAKTWDVLLEVFDEMVLVLKDEKITFDKYKETLKLGFKNKDLGSIPATKDQVIVGDIDRSKSGEIKATFIIGLNDGVFPSVNKNEGFLDDSNRDYLKEIGIEIAKTTRERIYEEQFNIYKAFTIASEHLYLSYPLGDANTNSLRASMLISKMKKIFKNIKEEYEKPENKDIKLKSNYKNIAEKIEENKISKLYGNPLRVSISKLEQYKQCPFSFYLKYGLRVKEKKSFKLESIDTGSFMHEVIDIFFTKINEEGLDIKTLSNEYIKSEIMNIVNEKLNLEKNYIFTSTPKFIALSNKLKRTIANAMEYIIYQLKLSDFKVMANEKEFNEIIDIGDNDKIELTGKIDRIDLGETSTDKFIRIIDYKSKVKSLDLNDVYYGVKLQLLTYLDSVAKVEDAKPAGVLYFELIDNIIKSNKNLEDEEIEAEIRKQFKMNGLVLANVEVIKMMDNSLEEGYSKIIPVRLSTKNEIINHNSNVLTEEQFIDVQKHIRRLLKNISKEILTGNININPYYKKGRSACTYCEYKSICGFTPGECGNNYNIINTETKEVILEKMKNEE